MPSRLSSLLVRDGLVGVKRMEKAFQRQVIYGGTLDTILLEMGLVPEERLTQYLALASGLPPAKRDEGASPEPEAIAMIPRELAEKHRSVPLAVDGDAVRLLVCSPLELHELEDLADVLDRALQPLITTEYRWHLAFAAAYGLDTPARFATLARALDVDISAAPAPVGRGTSVIVDHRASRITDAPLPPASAGAVAAAASDAREPRDTIPAPMPEMSADVPEWQREVPDGGGVAAAGSAAEWQRGVPDGGGVAAAGSAAEWQRGVPDGGGVAAAGSAAEWQRGFDDEEQTAPGGPKALANDARGDGAPDEDALADDSASRDSDADLDHPLFAHPDTAITPAVGVPLLAPVHSTAETMRIVAAEPHEPSTASGLPLALPAVPAPGPDDTARRHRQTIVGLEPNRAATDPSPYAKAPRGAEAALAAIASSGVTVAPTRRGRPVSGQIRRTKQRSIEPPTEEELRKDSPLPIVRARELLATATDRDTAFLTLLRAARSRARYAGLLAVQNQQALGRLALAESGIDTSGIASVAIALDVPSAFRTVVQTRQAHIGAIDQADPSIVLMVRRFGGTIPTSALLMPIELRGRVVAIVIAHRLHHDIKLVDVAELLPLASATADSLGRMIVKVKSAGYRSPESGPIAIETAQVEQVASKREPRQAGAWAVPDAPAVTPSVPFAAVEAPSSAPVKPPRAIDDLLDDIERAKEGEADAAIVEAIERASETLGSLMRRFPGRLRVDRFSVTGRALRGAQYGGLLELVVRLGSSAAELLIDKMSAAQRDVRFYATVCTAELRPRSAVYALVERVFDQDFGVRAMALEALAGYPLSELAHAMARARRAIRSVDPEVVLAATSAIVELGDIEAVGDLIGVLEAPGRAGEHAHKALLALTAQDFGTSVRKWRKWWDANRQRHRIEWLIDGLSHKDDALRAASIHELRRLTGEYFGYHHDLPRRERDAAAERWVAWWREAGHRRFGSKEDERFRPTAVLPSRQVPE